MTPTPTRLSGPDLLKVAGLLALFLGILLLDRGFANWRNDLRNFPNADGLYLPPPPDAPPLTFIETHGLERPMEYTGLALIALSVGLFGIRTAPAQPSRL